MDRDTAKALIEKYPNVELSFSHYYKYEFQFSGWHYEPENVGIEIDVWYGGNSDDIYRFTVTTEPRKVVDLDTLEADYNRVRVVNKATGEKYEYSNY